MAWNDLPLSDRARMMQLAVNSGITDLRTIQEVYNEFAEGGGIHIKPSHRGKFTALKERTGHSASWFKENGTPAQKKMATFALNARKWHHADGGFLNEIDYGFLESPNIFEKGGKKKKVWDHSISWYISHHPEKYPTFSKIKDLSLLDKYYTINDEGIFESNKDRYYKKSKQVRNSTGRIDYNKDNEIMLTTSGANARYRTGKISTDILDYIYDNAAKANIPLKEAIGLAGKESTLGIGRGYKAGAYISPIDLYSFWNGVGDATITNSQQKKLNSVYERLFNGEDVSDKELMEAEKQYEKMYNNLHDYEGDNLVRDAYNYYKAGKYNPGEKGYNDSVLIQGDAILQDKAVQNWLKTKKPYKGRGF